MRRARGALCFRACPERRSLTLAIAALAAAPAAAHAAEPTLTARAILPADATWPAPFPGRPEHRAGAGARLPSSPSAASPPCSRRRWRDGYLAMPDNGFGNKANSHSFLLRVYAVKPDRRRRRRSRARSTSATPTTRSPSSSSTRAPRSATSRAATSTSSPSASTAAARCGSARSSARSCSTPTRTGKVLEAPIPLPGVRSPDYPATPAARPRQPRLLQRLRGHGDLARRPHAVPDARGPAGRRRRQDDPPDVHLRHREAPLRDPATATYHVADPSLPRLRPHRARLDAASSRSSATTSRAPPPCTSRRSWSTRATAR